MSFVLLRGVLSFCRHMLGSVEEAEDAGEAHGERDVPAPSATCPHCGSTDGTLESAFGGSLMTRQIYCRGCRTVFEQVKWDDDPSPGGWLR